MDKKVVNEPLLDNKETVIDEKEKKLQEMLQKDIYENSNWLSKLFLIWITPLLKLSHRRPLEANDLGSVNKINQSKTFLNDLKEVWYKRKYQEKRKCSLLKTIMKVNMTRLILMFLFSVITFILDFVMIVILREYIAYFQEKTNPIIFGIELPLHVLGIIYLSCKLVYIFLSRQSQIVQTIVGFKSGIELSSLIYDKILKVGAKSRALFTEGELTNFVQIDAQKMGDWLYYAPQALIIPFQFAGYFYLLFSYFGIAFLFGLGAMLIIMIFISVLQSKYIRVEERLMTSKDERMRITSQTFNSLKILKLYAWEDEFLNKIRLARNKELVNLRSILNYDVIFISLYWSIPVVCSICSIGAYTYFNDELNIADIMASLTIFNYMLGLLWLAPWFVNGLMDTLIALGRIQKLLSQPDVDESVVEVDDKLLIENNVSIKIENASFVWDKDIIEKIKTNEDNKNISYSKVNEAEIKISITSNDAINNESKFLKEESNKTLINNNVENESTPKIILSDINLEFKKGELIGVIGEVGSGKSSLIQAILNNMIIFTPNKNDINLQTPPRLVVNGSISYVAQNSWIMNETLRNNIIFFKEYSEDKFNNVINICELKSDLEMLPGGDLTEIGEKGINLSGGQKTRVAIARAVYIDADIFMFDDPLSALDAHVGMKIFEQVISDHLKNKTRIIVTHALQYIQYMDRIIFMKEGKIFFIGSYSELIKQPFFNEFKEKIKTNDDKNPTGQKEEDVEESKMIEEIDIELKEGKKNKEVNRITVDEEKEKGRVKWIIYLKFVAYMGGLFIFIITFFSLFIWEALKAGSDLWLTFWSTMKSLTKEENFYYYIIYSSLALGSDVFTVLRSYLITRGIMTLNRNLHDNMIFRLIRAPINLFHDTKPKGQILNRLSKDLSNCSDAGFNYGSIVSQSFQFIGAFIICGLFQPWSILLISLLIIFCLILANYFIGAGRDLNRLEGISRSPILSQFSETYSGVATIRAFKYKHNFKEKLYKKLDEYYKVKMLSNGSNQWFGMYLDLIFYLLLVFLIVFSIIYKEDFSAQSMGLLLTYTIFLSENLHYLITEVVTFERSLTSLERCDEFTQIVQEQPYVKEIDLELENSKWPRTGVIKFKDFSAKYRPNTDVILKNLNFVTNSGEKIGVVGRTGSGKSTLCLSMFRILEAHAGTIYIDDVDISQIGLKKLRSSLTIIPQDPTLIEGTLKYNIDPVGLYTNEEIINIMNSIGLSNLIESNKESGGLEMSISENGDNLSVGEKQLICIARAILRKSKVVIMDEATSSIDIKTESLIQSAISHSLKDSTVITIAHRIKTIVNYDRIMVLHNGEIVEFDSPQTLIENKNSLFYQLYSKSNI